LEVYLLRDLLNLALHDPCEKSRISNFWVCSGGNGYENCIPLFEFFLAQEEMEWVANEDCKVMRVDGDFLIEDPYGGKDVFTHQEISCLIDLWKEVLKVEPNVIDFTE
jgi:hypothetical protein